MKTSQLKQAVFFKAAILMGLFLLVGGNSNAAFITADEGGIPNRYIITYQPQTAANPTFGTAMSAPGAAEVANELIAVYGSGKEKIHYVYEHAMKGFAATMDEKIAIALSNDPKVLRVEQDGMAYASDTQNGVTWGIDRIDQRDPDLSDSYTYATKASNVHAYILDTGLNAAHSEFSGRVGNGYDAIGDGGGTKDNNGHGTHVAGTVGGTNYGVAKGVTFHAVQVLDRYGSGTWSAIISGIDWVTGNYIKPAVANMSLGGSSNASVDDAVRESINAGVTYAVAAGNDNNNACNYSPAEVSTALTAGASAWYDSRSSFSNWGDCVDLFAPGSSITSASHVNNSGTRTMSGTSMASPHICGVAALYLTNHPNASPATVKSAIENAASPNKISGVNGSPNLLLYSLFDSTPPADEYQLSVNIVGEGQVSLDPPGGSYKPDGKVVVTAFPSLSWSFSEWSGDQNGITNPVTIIMSSDKNITTTFTSDPGENSCVGHCRRQAPGGCWCDYWCRYYNDCCSDKVQTCGR